MKSPRCKVHFLAVSEIEEHGSCSSLRLEFMSSGDLCACGLRELLGCPAFQMCQTDKLLMVILIRSPHTEAGSNTANTRLLLLPPIVEKCSQTQTHIATRNNTDSVNRVTGQVFIKLHFINFRKFSVRKIKVLIKIGGWKHFPQYPSLLSTYQLIKVTILPLLYLNIALI